MLRDSPDGIRLKDAAERVAVSKLTVQRDIDELSASAIPIGERHDGQTHLYFLCDQGASLPILPAGLGAREIASLEAAHAALAPYRPSPLIREMDGVKSKLSGTAAKGALSRFEGSSQRALRAAPASLLDVLLEAILSTQRCEVAYQARWAKRARQYELEPLGFRLLDGLIYLEARVPPYKNTAVFVTHLISKARLLPQNFRRPRRRPRTGFGVFEGKPENVEVRFQADIAHYIAERLWHPSQKLEAKSDGTLVLRAKLSGMNEFIGWVMSWGGRAELRKPASWREELRQRAQSLLASHHG